MTDKLHFEDLTKINVPYGLLDECTQKRLRECGSLELYDEVWRTTLAPLWYASLVYRQKPEPLTKPSIDWSQIQPEYKWLARDENAGCYVYDTRPEISQSDISWRSYHNIEPVNHLTSLDLGTCHWKDSLVERPQNV